MQFDRELTFSFSSHGRAGGLASVSEERGAGVDITIVEKVGYQGTGCF